VFTLDETGRAVARAERRGGVDRFPPALSQSSVECSLVEDAVRLGRAVRSLHERTGEFVIAVWFSTPDGVRGVVRISRNVADEPDFADEMPAYEQAVGQLVRMVSLGLKTASIWDRAIKDEKTGLYNANHYQDQMKRQVAIAQRTGAPLSLIMLDVDKFKHINDTYGHLAGDTVLAEISNILKREARESDTPYRYGGEELCIVCCGTTEEEAAKAAERMRHIIACHEFHDDRGRLLPISASFGVAEFDPSRMKSEKDLKEACDRALYVAKENGRNVVVVNTDSGRFAQLERSGDVSQEIKRRLGLAGDNSPLDGDAEPAKLFDEKAASARAQLGESIDALATGIADVVGNDSQRARVVDVVVREATEFLTRNLSARLGSAEAEPKPKRKRAPRKPKPLQPGAVRGANVPQETHRVSEEATGQPVPAPAPHAPKRRRKTKAEREAEAALKAAMAADAAAKADLSAEAVAKAESDRLDYLTDEEGSQLAAGKAPSKRLRKLTGSRKSA